MRIEYTASRGELMAARRAAAALAPFRWWRWVNGAEQCGLGVGFAAATASLSGVPHTNAALLYVWVAETLVGLANGAFSVKRRCVR